jgi:hypothetical protein
MLAVLGEENVCKSIPSESYLCRFPFVSPIKIFPYLSAETATGVAMLTSFNNESCCAIIEAQPSKIIRKDTLIFLTD